MAEKFLGHPINWYMKFFNEDSAASVMDANPESLTSLVYPTTPEDWKINMCPLGAAKEWVSSGKVAPPPEWLSQEELDTHVRIFQKGKYTGPLNWYVHPNNTHHVNCLFILPDRLHAGYISFNLQK